MAFWDGLNDLFRDRQHPPVRVDVRNPQQQATWDMLRDEYSQANANPFFGIPGPGIQTRVQDELTRDILARTASGAGHSGYQSDQVRKGLVDFRIGMIRERQRALDALRSGLIQSQGPAMQAMPADIQAGIGSQAANAFAGRAAGAAARGLFGDDDDAAQEGGGWGTTGYRPNGNMRVT